ncbi:hypothetical protein K491DRAFT_751975 [Lophiostoma macrostomum CBS 122681]|uniref:Inosine/uridine-preferring nucleoside hydrolase domain-containing protein n=1 Tax=Lophiostoma macrostomum CBS 122681 TaxID=1314788 RepID=A0A6A6T3P6_9PLEO|nr:hypothetical protein K491DRAFT_751975 [Lophiostoma macrostomum CBS 122681]
MTTETSPRDLELHTSSSLNTSTPELNTPELLEDVDSPVEDAKDIPHILIITDIGHDADDAMALAIMAKRHAMKKIKIVGVIATLKPEVMKRAKMALWMLREFDIEDVEVAKGTDGTERRQDPFGYEFVKRSERLGDSLITKDYLDLATRVFENASRTGSGLHVLSIGGHRDVWAIMSNNKDLTWKAVSQIHIQGGCYFGKATVDKESPSEEEIAAAAATPDLLRPNFDAANNNFDRDASRNLYTFLAGEAGIKTVTYTKEAAAKASFKPEIFESLVVANDPLAAIGCAGIVGDSVLNPQTVGALSHMLQIGQEVNSTKLRDALREQLSQTLGQKYPTFHEGTSALSQTGFGLPPRTPTC